MPPGAEAPTGPAGRGLATILIEVLDTVGPVDGLTDIPKEYRPNGKPGWPAQSSRSAAQSTRRRIGGSLVPTWNRRSRSSRDVCSVPPPRLRGDRRRVRYDGGPRRDRAPQFAQALEGADVVVASRHARRAENILRFPSRGTRAIMTLRIKAKSGPMSRSRGQAALKSLARNSRHDLPKN